MRGLIVGVGVLLSAQPAHAVILRLTPLKDVFAESQLIFTVAVDALDPDKPSVTFKLDESLKGKPPFEKLPVNLTGDSEAKKSDDTAKLLKRLAVKMPLVIFATKQDTKTIAFAYTNGTWFQIVGTEVEKDKTSWSFTHCEPYFRRTFKGTTEELKQVVVDALADKKKPPDADPKEKPGLGPEVKDEEKKEKEDALIAPAPSDSVAPSGPLFAVIPSVAIGSAVAVLAALFPAVFGGLMVVLKRSMRLLSVAGLNSTLWTLYLLVPLLPSDLSQKLSMDPLIWWLLMLAIVMLGVLWSWQVNLAAARKGEPIGEEPPRVEKILYWAGSLLALAGVALFCWKAGRDFLKLDELLTRRFLLVYAIAAWVGLAYVLCKQAAASVRGDWRAGLPLEGVVLGAMLIASTAVAVDWPRAKALQSLEQSETVSPAVYVGEVWNFTAPGNAMMDVSPLIDGKFVYCASANRNVFGGDYGKVYCLDKETREVAWTFPDDQSMKSAFSSPCLADGRIYFGEGFHQDSDCKLYCLDAATGKKLWDFPTTSHTESSPCVAGGKVFFGAGDDGLYCVDAITGAKLWHYENSVHIDGNPVVAGNRLYVGSGEGDQFQKFEICCLDTETGKPIWNQPTDLPAWGAPVVSGDQVFVGIGNGNFMTSDDHPKGAMLCLTEATGKEQWRFDVADGVHVRPAVERRYVYFASRDGYCYCLDRKDGRQVWKRDLGSPIVASPALARCTCHACGTSLFVAATGGLFCSLDPANGEVQWHVDFSKYVPQLLSSPVVEASKVGDGELRRIYFGASLNGGVTAVLYCLEDRYEE
jgi:outer membrane protein assembly factor BamB